jgi:hypothetical protein
MWEAELIGPVSKFVVSHVQGKRDECLIRSLLQDGANRLVNRHRLVLLTDGEASYASLFPEIFGQPYCPVETGVEVVCPLYATVSRARWHMFRSSNTARAVASFKWISAMRTVPERVFIRCLTAWGIPRLIPRSLSGATARPVA